MSDPISPDAITLEVGPVRGIGPAVAIGVGAWLCAVVALGAAGFYLGAPGKPPLAVFGSAMTPLFLFGLAWRMSAAFREFVLALDLRFVTALQGWRYAGFGFIALYTNQVLPGLFAWPAGLGDMAIGIAAPLWVVTLADDPGAVARRGFRLWNIFGIFDFVVAFSAATFCAMTIGADTLPSITPMGQLPLILIPAFMVPLFAMLHIVALIQSNRARVRNG